MASAHATFSKSALNITIKGQTSRAIKNSVARPNLSSKVLARPVARHQSGFSSTSARFRQPIMSSSESSRQLAQPPAQGPEQPTASIGMEEWDELSSERKIQWLLNNAGDTEWGWVIYRTCYKPELDSAWESLKSTVLATARQRVASSDAPAIADKMDWVFVEDRQHLDGATRLKLKRRFRDWAVAENPSWNIEGEEIGRGSRYSFFIQVDEPALLSMAAGANDADTTPSDGRPHVNIVQAWEDADDVEDWMKIQTGMLNTDFFVELNNDEAWFTFYTPPDGVCRM